LGDFNRPDPPKLQSFMDMMKNRTTDSTQDLYSNYFPNFGLGLLVWTYIDEFQV